MSIITSQVRTNLGPLTTTFVPPPACSIGVAQCTTCDLAWWGQSCGSKGVQDVTTCWPTTSSGVAIPPTPLFGWGFYSPGVQCPAEHTSACTAIYGVDPDWDIQFRLRPSETAIGCCPKGFQCTNLNGQTCRLVATSTAVPTVNCESGTSAAFSYKTIPDNNLPTPISTYYIFAPMIQLVYQASDTSSSSTRETSSITTSPSSSHTGGVQNGSSGSQLGGGAIAGIVIGAVVLVLAIAGIAFLLRRRRKSGAGSGSGPGTSPSAPRVELETGSDRNELYSPERKPREVQNANTVQYPPPEPAELPGQDWHQELSPGARQLGQQRF